MHRHDSSPRLRDSPPDLLRRPSARTVRQQGGYFGGSPFPSPAVWRCAESYSWRPRLYHNFLLPRASPARLGLL